MNSPKYPRWTKSSRCHLSTQQCFVACPWLPWKEQLPTSRESGLRLAALGSFIQGWCLITWKIWSIGRFRGVKVMEPSAFVVVWGAYSFGARARCPLACFLELSCWRFSWSSCETATLDLILLSLAHKSFRVTGCWWASEEDPFRTSRPNSMTHCWASRKTFICVSSWWLTCVTASRFTVSRWMATSSRSWSAFALCSSNHHCSSITTWTSYPHESAVGSKSFEVLMSCQEVLLCAMIAICRCLHKDLKSFEFALNEKHEMQWVIPKESIHVPK